MNVTQELTIKVCNTYVHLSGWCFLFSLVSKKLTFTLELSLIFALISYLFYKNTFVFIKKNFLASPSVCSRKKK